MCTNIKSLCCTFETNNVICLLYFNFKKTERIKDRRVLEGPTNLGPEGMEEFSKMKRVRDSPQDRVKRECYGKNFRQNEQKCASKK